LGLLSSTALCVVAYRLWGPSLTNFGFQAPYVSFFIVTFFYFLCIGLIGTLIAKYANHSRFSGFFLPALFIIIPGIIIVWYGQVLQYRYLLVIIPFLFIYFGKSLAEIFIFLKNKQDKFFTITCLIILCLFGAKNIYFQPSDSFKLERGSPQPDFKTAYILIQKTISPGDLIISPYTHMTKIYMGQPGLWLPISLTGRRDEIAQKTVAGTKDYYTGAHKIQDNEELAEIMNTHRGYIVIDAMARTRLGAETLHLIENSTRSTRVYQTGADTDRLEIFHFN
jgi:hypothetical protein